MTIVVIIWKDFGNMPEDIILHLTWDKASANGHNVSVVNTLRPRQNGRHFADDTFKRIFCSYESNWQYASIVLDNGIAPIKRQAIIWSNDGKFTDAYVRRPGSMSFIIPSLLTMYILA